MTTLQIRTPKFNSTLSVFISPCNENQELNYMETFKGTPDEIVRHSLEIIKGLKATLRLGTFSIKIESPNLEDCIYVDEQNIYDEEFNVISQIKNASQFLR